MKVTGTGRAINQTMPPSASLDVAVRAWTKRPHQQAGGNSNRGKRSTKPYKPHHALVFDTETATDFGQSLNFGFARYVRIDGTTVTTLAEILFHADDLAERDPDGYKVLGEFAASHTADVELAHPHGEPEPRLLFIPRAEFAYRWLWKLCHTKASKNPLGPAMIVGFNLPFDLSRLAVGGGEARGFYRGGFSLEIWDNNTYRPRIRMKILDSKKAFINFAQTEHGTKRFGGQFLDLRTLAFDLTNTSHTLNSACQAFGTSSKIVVTEHGTISPAYVAYGRQDVKATTELLEELLIEFALHPINLSVTKAYSPASIAKAYLKAMGVTPILERNPDFPAAVLGKSMAAFYGGRAEVRVRRIDVPVVYTDFTSMYPTVDTLMGLWELLTAKRIEVIDATEEVQQLLDTITAGDCLTNPAVWRSFIGIAEIKPDGNVLPVRAKYDEDSWNIGVNHFTSSETFAYSIPDLVGSKILTGKTPRVERAREIRPIRRAARHAQAGEAARRGHHRPKVAGLLQNRRGATTAR